MSGVAFVGLAVALLLLPRATRLTPAQDRAWCRRLTAAGILSLPFLTVLALKG